MATDLCPDEQDPQASNMRIDHTNKHACRRPSLAAQVALEEVQIKISVSVSESGPTV